MSFYFAIFFLFAAVGFIVVHHRATSRNLRVHSLYFALAMCLISMGTLLTGQVQNARCEAPTGSTIQWRETVWTGDAYTPMVYLRRSDDSFCRVASHELYHRGLGAVTERPYSGTNFGAIK